MSDQPSAIQELADVPKEFFKDGTQFINRCTKPDRREFIKISQAVGMGFLIMGAIGYFIKLSTSLPLLLHPSLPPSFSFPTHTPLFAQAHREATSTDQDPPAVHIPVNNVLVG
ncbi:protein translocase SEC61 complex gamma subunit, archaeal and eukaryotic [Cyphellophora europaea CBS 101466]|uniref:Protein translocase SEC61 complex gamma subunit, archaeal and eukaryotic n=1 Tax=Cyphellophora europaea (strain CBS 101466) TaxID=1220924 RepID=W2SCD0_CYPE1|nr:protein translocase SEC61 complex gamma subunit, archaeal and eukaryotic [Cyphellophora europaea CBS 101466]ETN45584.1 protein translocase SEC61 complex gamma subunit, archaeal and eukaryotic [Cyphellophora europaea CBS 101466]